MKQIFWDNWLICYFARGKIDFNSNSAFENMLEQQIVNVESSKEDYEEDSDPDDMDVVLDDDQYKNWILV